MDTNLQTVFSLEWGYWLFMSDEVQIDMAKFTTASVVEWKKHKEYCSDVENCHVYAMIETILSEVLNKELVIVLMRNYK